MSVEIKINNAIKRYGDNTIIGDLSLDVREGEVFHSPWTIWMWENNIITYDCWL